MIATSLVLALTMNVPSSLGPPESLREGSRRFGIEFGTCVELAHLQNEPLRKILLKEFSVIEAENVMKFGPIHPRPGSGDDAFDFRGSDELADFAKRNRMRFRGHVLIWHNQNPPWLGSGSPTPEAMRETMNNHIDKVVGRYRGRVYAWDVVNEAFQDDGTIRSSVWYDRPGIGYAGQGTAYIEHALRQAHQADPKAKLYYNDYGAETLGKKADAIYAMAKDFKARKVPLHGIGFQAHLIMAMHNEGALNSIKRNFERFAKLGLDIEITELDIRLPNGSAENLAEQAAFYGKFVELCRRQPRVKLIQTWGISDKHSWIPRAFRGMGWALPWDDQYQKKPAYRSILDALTGECR